MTGRISQIIWLFLLTAGLLGLVLVGNSGPTQAASPIKIAIIQDQSGAHADAGISERYGYQLALDEANDAGGIKGRKIEYTIGDDGGNVDRGISLAKRAVERDKVSVIFGSDVSTVAFGIVKTAIANRTPQVSGAASTPLFQGTTPQDNGYWCFGMIDNEYLAVDLLSLAKGAGLKKLAITYINLAWGQDMRNACRKYASQYGIQILGEVAMESGATEVTAEVSKLRTLNPEGILVLNYPGDSAAVYRALAALAWSLPTFPLGMQVPSIVKMVDPSLLNGAVFGLMADTAAPEFVQLVQRGEKYYNKKILLKDYYCRAYNAASAAVKALAACKDPTNPSEVRDQLEKVKPFPTVAPVPGNLLPQQWHKIPHIMFTELCPFTMKDGKMVRK